MTNLGIAILAGGKSSRMGTDKAYLIRQGETLLERTARIALSTHLPVVVCGREKPAQWELEDVIFLPDKTEGLGPIGGLYTSLMHFNKNVLLIACDMPLLNKAALNWIIEADSSPVYQDGLAVYNQGQLEPTFSIYCTSCLTVVESQIAAGQRSLQRLIEKLQFTTIEAPDIIIRTLVNVNTKEDWLNLDKDL